MSMQMDQRLLMPRQTRRFSVVNNGDGTATWTMAGYTHPDSGGSVVITYGDELGSDLFSETYSYDDTTATITINDNSVPYYFRYTAYDTADSEITHVDFGPIAITGDTEGELFLAYQESLGYVYESDERQAYINWFADNRADGILDKIIDAWFFLYNNNTYNRSLAISRQAGSFVGTATPSTDRVTFSSNGYFNPGRTIADLGLTAANSGFALIYPASVSLGTGADFGISSGGGNLELTPRYSNAGSKGYFRMGGATNGTNSFEAVNTTAYSAAGMWVQSRKSTTNACVKFSDWTTIATVSSSTSFSGTTFVVPTTLSPYFGGLNAGGALASATNRPYSAGFYLSGMTGVEVDLFILNTQTLLDSLGVI